MVLHHSERLCLKPFDRIPQQTIHPMSSIASFLWQVLHFFCSDGTREHDRPCWPFSAVTPAFVRAFIDSLCLKTADREGKPSRQSSPERPSPFSFFYLIMTLTIQWFKGQEPNFKVYSTADWEPMSCFEDWRNMFWSFLSLSEPELQCSEWASADWCSFEALQSEDHFNNDIYWR